MKYIFTRLIKFTVLLIRRKFVLIVGFLLATSCIEPYKFRVEDQDNGIAIESYISNKSYNETLSYPSDGRYFTVLIKNTSDVINIHDKYITNASVSLFDKNGNQWTYTEAGSEGHYYLLDNDFKAQFGQEYQLQITLESGTSIFSAWEKLPVTSTQIGDIHITETEKEQYVQVNDTEKIIQSFKGVDVSVDIMDETARATNYYQWTFDPLWVFKAAYSSPGQTGYQCWVTNNRYLNTYALEKHSGNAVKKKLFFLKTIGNEKIYDYFSVLITQRVLSSGYYNFWKELKDQNERGGLFDQPPYSLQTNFSSDNSGVRISGYFGVVTESATRWVLDKNKLSYFVENDLKAQCDANICLGGPCPPPSCSDCTYYIYGNTTTQKPTWW